MIFKKFTRDKSCTEMNEWTKVKEGPYLPVTRKTGPVASGMSEMLRRPQDSNPSKVMRMMNTALAS